MSTTYGFKTQEEMEAKQRVIVSTVPVPATEQKIEFTLAQKEQDLANAEQQLLDAQKRVDAFKLEITTVKKALEIEE